MMNGISNRDFMLVANGVLIISIFVAICNLVVDILSLIHIYHYAGSL